MPRRTRGKTSSATASADADSAAQTAQLLLALLLLAVDEREAHGGERPKQIKTEVLLSRAGLSSPLIATLVNKQPGAVRTALSRAKGDQTG
jgi:DNA-directed RNA polymerase specialized sigma24 family protein